MDREVIEQKLESLRRCLQRVEEKCPPTAEILAADLDRQDILALNFSRAVQLCVDIGAHIVASRNVAPPATMGQTFDVLAGLRIVTPELAVRMKNAVGFRNIAVHNYEAINWQIVHAICDTSFKRFQGLCPVDSPRILKGVLRDIACCQG